MFEDGAEMASWGFDDPTGVAVAPDGTIFVTAADDEVDRGSDQSHSGRLLHLGADGDTIETFGSMNRPTALRRTAAAAPTSSTTRRHASTSSGKPARRPVPRARADADPGTDDRADPGRDRRGQPARGSCGARAAARCQRRASAVAGDVKVGKGKKLHSLKGRELIPIGSTVDASAGRVKLEFETAPGEDRGKYGRLMDGEFFDGTFTISQPGNDSLVDLNLLDDALAARSSGARASASRSCASGARRAGASAPRAATAPPRCAERSG